MARDPSARQSQSYLIWRRFRRHRLAVASAVFLVGLYAVALSAEFFQTRDAQDYLADYAMAPPQRVRFFEAADRGARFRPHVYGYTPVVDPESGCSSPTRRGGTTSGCSARASGSTTCSG